MIDNHVVNLELSKQLYKAGINVQSEFYWVFRGMDDENREVWELFSGKEVSADFVDFTRYPAPLSSELGELLPVILPDDPCDLESALPYKTLGGYWRVDLDDEGMLCAEENEANARAKMLLYLKDKGLLS